VARHFELEIDLRAFGGSALIGDGEVPKDRAVDAMASWAFTAGFRRLDLEHAVGNTASCRVAEKTGFAAEGVRRSAWLLADGRCDVHAHARLR